MLLQPVKVLWEAGGRDSHELTGAFTSQLAGTCHLAVTYGGAHIQGAIFFANSHHFHSCIYM